MMPTSLESHALTLGAEVIASALVELASIAGVVANACDHAEHNEPVALADVLLAAERLRDLGQSLAQEFGRPAVELYAERLGQVERRNVVHCEEAYDGETAALSASTWRDLQLIQAAHDRYFHTDVAGLAKNDQLRHYALHLAKLAGATADLAAGRIEVEDYIGRRVADIVLFGIKLSTVLGARLSDEPLGEAS